MIRYFIILRDIERLGLVFGVWEVLGSSTDPEIGYSDWNFLSSPGSSK